MTASRMERVSRSQPNMAMPKKSHPQNWKVQNSAGFWKERGMEDLLRAGGYSRLSARQGWTAGAQEHPSSG